MLVSVFVWFFLFYHGFLSPKHLSDTEFDSWKNLFQTSHTMAQYLSSSIPANLTAVVSSVLSAPRFFANLVGSSFIEGFRTVTYISTVLLVLAAAVSFLRSGERRQKLFSDKKQSNSF